MIRAALLALLLVPAITGWAQRQADTTITDFAVPEFGPNNELKSKLTGRFARMRPNGQVDITGLSIEFYDLERRVQMRVTAETCLYNRVTRNAESEQRVRIARENMVITGEGFQWNAGESRFRIFKDSKVVLKEITRSVKENDDE